MEEEEEEEDEVDEEKEEEEEEEEKERKEKEEEEEQEEKQKQDEEVFLWMASFWMLQVLGYVTFSVAVCYLQQFLANYWVLSERTTGPLIMILSATL